MRCSRLPALPPNGRSCHATTTTKQEIHELLAALSTCFQRLKDKTAYLALKRSELQPDSFISQSLYTEAAEELHIEQSVLAGHAQMVREMLARQNMILDRDSQRLLNDILKYTDSTAPDWGIGKV